MAPDGPESCPRQYREPAQQQGFVMPMLQRVVGHTVKDTTCYKWQIVLQKDTIEGLGWQEGDGFEATTEDGVLVLRQAEGT